MVCLDIGSTPIEYTIVQYFYDNLFPYGGWNRWKSTVSFSFLLVDGTKCKTTNIVIICKINQKE